MSKYAIISLCLATCASADAAPPKPAGSPAKPVERVKLVRTPESGLQPQTAVDADGTLHLIYYTGNAGAGEIFYVKRPAGAQEFSKPLRVNSQPGSAIATGSIRGAQLAIGRNSRVHVAWNGSGKAEPKGPGKYANPMLYARLNDAGTAFEPQRNVISTAYTLDGGGSVAADARGNVYVAWHGNPQADGEEHRRVYVVRSNDDGRTFSTETPVDSSKQGVCGCCGLRAFASSEGKLYLLYRSARADVNRDMQLLVSAEPLNADLQNMGGFSSRMLDAWKIAQCPMSSEAFAESKESILGAWETNGQVQFTRIDKRTGRPGPAISPAGSPRGRKHPSLAVNARGETLLVWDEGTAWERGGAVAWQVFDAAGKPTSDRGRKDGIPVWSFAAAYAEPDGSFVIVY